LKVYQFGGIVRSANTITTIVPIAIPHGIEYNLAQYENIPMPTSSENFINL